MKTNPTIIFNLFNTFFKIRILATLIAICTFINISTINLAYAGSLLDAKNLNISGQISEKTLANGVRVIVKTDRRAPTVAHTVWYRVGAIDEPEGLTGISHMLEHMMFKGTLQIPAGEFSKKVAAAGGRNNAYTSRDNTTYFQLIPKESLPEMMELEADRMVNLIIDETEFKKENMVVQEERRLRTEDRPQSLYWERMMAFSYINHPYGHPIIGWMNDLKNHRADDMRAWYQNFYAPSKATVVIVGDVSAEEVFTLAEKTYGKVKTIKPDEQTLGKFKAIPAQRQVMDISHQGMRTVNMKAPARLYSIDFIYSAPNLVKIDDWKPYALSLLAMVLDGHSAARLPQKLVKKKQIAVSIDTSYGMFSRGPTLFVISGALGEKHKPKELANAIRAEINKIISQGVNEDELKRAKRQLAAQSIFKLDSMFGQAREIGSMEILGLGYSAIEDVIANMQKVSRAQIQEVAKEYLNDDNLTYGTLIPTKK